MVIQHLENPDGTYSYRSTWHVGKHVIKTDWTNCRVISDGDRIDWKRSIGQTITIEYDDKKDTFKIEEYIAKPSETAHDAKIKLKSISTRKEYTLWSRDLKQGDCKKLFV